MKEEFDKLLNILKTTNNNQEYIFYAWSEEVGELCKKYCPNIKVVVPPKFCAHDEENENTVFVIPVNNNKLVRVCFDNEEK